MQVATTASHVGSIPGRREERRGGGSGDPRHGDRDRCCALEGQRAGEHLEEDHAQRVDVGGRSDVSSEDLLRSHVPWSAQQSLDSQRRLAPPLALQCPGDSEVGDDHPLGASVRDEHHIGALEIAVDDSLGMCRLQSVDHLLDQGQRLRGSQRAGTEPFGEGLAFEQFHGEEEEWFTGELRGEELEDAANVPMGDSPCEENLPAEAFAGSGVIRPVQAG